MSWRAAATAGVAAALLLAGCTDNRPRTLEEALSPRPTTAAPTTKAPAASPRPTVRPFPRTCAELLSVDQVLDVLARPLRGRGSYVYAGPVPRVGRLERITCGYGVSPARRGGPPVPRVEITLNRYRAAGVARERLQDTVGRAQAEGQQIRSLPLRGRPGYVLTDPVESSYVVADGARTLVVTIRRSVVSAAAAPVVLVDLASRALGLGPAAPLGD